MENNIKDEEFFLDSVVIKEEYCVEDNEISAISAIELKPGLKQEDISDFTIGFICVICGEVYENEKQLRKHTRTHKNKKTFTCGKCCATFQSRKLLSKHLYVHLEEVSLTCSTCEAKCTDAFHLLSHTNTVHLVEVCKCGYCGKKFLKLNDLSLHLARAHPKNFREKYKEKEHLECQFCYKKFNSSSAFKVHIYLHKGSKPYVCAICNMAFYNKTLLKSHHTTVHKMRKRRESNVNCLYCGNKYTSKKTLFDHIRKVHQGLPVDTDGPLFSCSVCKNSYDSMEKLEQHIQIHELDLPHKCETCGKQFLENFRRLRHIQTVHVEGEALSTCKAPSTIEQ